MNDGEIMRLLRRFQPLLDVGANVSRSELEFVNDLLAQSPSALSPEQRQEAKFIIVNYREWMS